MDLGKMATNLKNSFRQFHFTFDYLIKLETITYETFANKQYMIAVWLDIKKAYNMEKSNPKSSPQT